MIYGGVVPLEPAAGRVLGRLRGHHRATELLLDPAPKGRTGAQQHRDVPWMGWPSHGFFYPAW